MKLRGMALVVGAGAVALAAANAQAGILDLTGATTNGSINNAVYEQGTLADASGTGTFVAFVRVHQDSASDGENGYNSSMSNYFYDETNAFTYDLVLGDIPVVSAYSGSYREFYLDINEVGTDTKKFLSLDDVKIFVSATKLTGDAPSLAALDALASTTKVYDMDSGGDSAVLLNYSLAPGSGKSDMRLLVLDSAFSAFSGTAYVYLYSAFGLTTPANDSRDFTFDDGFEEWAIRTASLSTVVPLPSSAWMGLLGLGGLGYLQFRRRRQNQTLDV